MIENIKTAKLDNGHIKVANSATLVKKMKRKHDGALVQEKKRKLYLPQKEEEKGPNPLLENIASQSAKVYLKNVIENQKIEVEELEDVSILATSRDVIAKEYMSQEDIVKNMPDTLVNSYRFDIYDADGPYMLDYSRNGRFLLMGDRLGKMIIVEWKSKNEIVDFQAGKAVRALKFLHKDNFFAAAQEDFLYVYNNQGIEMHAVKAIADPRFMEYLPYHMVLAIGTGNSYLKFLDVAEGKMVTEFPTHRNEITMMCQNPDNALILTGHTTGTVNFWSPNMKKPVMKMICHGTGMNALAVDYCGNYMVTSGNEGRVKVWDLRNTQKMLADLRFGSQPTHLEFAQTGLLAVGYGRNVKVISGAHLGSARLDHDKTGIKGGPNVVTQFCSPDYLSQLRFCPYEDVLGVTTTGGFHSLLVPGAGRANFDSYQHNPYAETHFNAEKEVKDLLQRVPPTMIGMKTVFNSQQIATIRTESVTDQWNKDVAKYFGEKMPEKIESKNSKRLKKKSVVRKDVEKKDSIHFERLKLEKKKLEIENPTFGVKQPLTRKTTGSVLDHLIPKRH